MKVLSKKHREKVITLRIRNNGGYTKDNANVCFDNPGKREKKEDKKDELLKQLSL